MVLADEDDPLPERAIPLLAPTAREALRAAGAIGTGEPVARQHDDEERRGGNRLVDQRLELVAKSDASRVAPDLRTRLSEFLKLVEQLFMEAGDEPLGLPAIQIRRRRVMVAA